MRPFDCTFCMTQRNCQGSQRQIPKLHWNNRPWPRNLNHTVTGIAGKSILLPPLSALQLGKHGTKLCDKELGLFKGSKMAAALETVEVNQLGKARFSPAA